MFVLKRYNKERQPLMKERCGRGWRCIRDRYIKVRPLCEECLKNNKTIVAEEVHHIIPLSKGGDSSDNSSIIKYNSNTMCFLLSTFRRSKHANSFEATYTCMWKHSSSKNMILTIKYRRINNSFPFKGKCYIITIK